MNADRTLAFADIAIDVASPAGARILEVCHELGAAWQQLTSVLRNGPRVANRTLDLDMVARLLVQTHAARNKHLDIARLGEPAWDMLLDLYMGSRKGIAVSSLCIAAMVPATTALRHIARLEGAGFVIRNTDRLDRRRTLVQLSEVGRQQLEDVLGEVRLLLLAAANDMGVIYPAAETRSIP